MSNEAIIYLTLLLVIIGVMVIIQGIKDRKLAKERHAELDSMANSKEQDVHNA